MDIAVIGSPEFTLGFQLAGISTTYNPDDEEATVSVVRELLNTKGVGIVVIDSAILSSLPDRLKERITESVTPTVLGIGTEEDTTLRETIRKAIGVDLWK
ncbi:MAG: V-type ATP synthase subunit F [Candidatus Poseidoniaceae archaeon]|jgi:V/A-type H+-transporting ATPase subunit F|nr:V-type ATP synthase subunit F [Candidatus Poseidoniaceae archaeon]